MRNRALFVVALAVLARIGTAQSFGQQRTPWSAPNRLRVLVPAYFYPVTNSPWARLNAVAAAHAGRVVAIGNPASGPGMTTDPSYVSAFASFQASGGRLIGYVSTSYAARPLALVTADIDAWFARYSPDGIFLDEMSTVPGAHEAYYAAARAHVLRHRRAALVVGNPGVVTVPSYLQWQGKTVVNVACVQENSTNFLGWQNAPWTASFPRDRFYALPYAVPASGWQAAVDHAWNQRCGWVYVTDDVLPNPWDTLPAYFEALVGYVAANH